MNIFKDGYNKTWARVSCAIPADKRLVSFSLILSTSIEQKSLDFKSLPGKTLIQTASTRRAMRCDECHMLPHKHTTFIPRDYRGDEIVYMTCCSRTWDRERCRIPDGR